MSDNLKQLIDKLQKVLKEKGENDPEYKNTLDEINRLSGTSSPKRKIESSKTQSNGVGSKIGTTISSLFIKKPKKNKDV